MKYTIALAGLSFAAAAASAQSTPAHHASSGSVAKPAATSKIATRDDGVRVVTVTANDYAFDAPDSIPAGLTELRLLNRGTEMHHVWLIRLDGGKTMKDLFAALGPHGALPAWAHDVGGPNTPGPNGESSAILKLATGRYAMICVIPSPDGKAHVMKGMAKEVFVTPAPAGPSANLVVSSTMTLSDYAFQFSAPLAAGRQAIRVRNVAAQGHEVVIVRLQEGKKIGDMLAWMEMMQGPPPGAPIGGTTPMARNEENVITLDLTPGEYGLICFAPDAKDGKPHFVHGMVSQFTIPAAR